MPETSNNEQQTTSCQQPGIKNGEGETLIKVDGASKKFCRNLKRALWYGVRDIGSQMLGQDGNENLRREEFWAVKDVSFELKRGECLGLIGRNGAGKSTLLKMLNGLIMPDRGEIRMRGNVGALIELSAGMNPILTGRENIYNKGAVLGFSRKEMDAKLDRIVEYSELEEFIDTPFQHYSSGMKVRLGFAVSAHLSPDVLLIDEVLAVGDRGFKAKCLDTISKLLQNSAVIFVSHSMPMVSRICTDVLLLERGKTEFHDRNVGQGIDMYHAKFGGMEKSVFSDGRIEVAEVALKNGHSAVSWDDERMFEFKSGDDLTVMIRLNLNEQVENVDLTLVFWNQNLVPVADCKSELTGFRVKGRKGIATVNVRIPQFYLNGGLHSLGLTVENTKTRERYAKVHNAITFQCHGKSYSHTGFVFPGQWTSD